MFDIPMVERRRRGHRTVEGEVHRPAAGGVGVAVAAVVEQQVKVAPGLFEGVGENGQAIKRCVRVDAAGEGEDGLRPPAGVEMRRLTCGVGRGHERTVGGERLVAHGWPHVAATHRTTAAGRA
jgi:hypothetical protein